LCFSFIFPPFAIFGAKISAAFVAILTLNIHVGILTKRVPTIGSSISLSLMLNRGVRRIWKYVTALRARVIHFVPLLFVCDATLLC
jgi:hypothetical protein